MGHAGAERAGQVCQRLFGPHALADSIASSVDRRFQKAVRAVLPLP
jgi:hypothetical protein